MIEAYDNYYPDQRTEGDLTVYVDRNPVTPNITDQVIIVNVSDSFPLGGVITQLTAVDSDGVRFCQKIISFTRNVLNSSGNISVYIDLFVWLCALYNYMRRQL